ncbi:MAG: hypothetical protein ACI815_002469 [Psychroserpens sp.]|jgi:hypothetical protein
MAKSVSTYFPKIEDIKKAAIVMRCLADIILRHRTSNILRSLGNYSSQTRAFKYQTLPFLSPIYESHIPILGIGTTSIVFDGIQIKYWI